jgi:hypothetical protein
VHVQVITTRRHVCVKDCLEKREEVHEGVPARWVVYTRDHRTPVHNYHFALAHMNDAPLYGRFCSWPERPLVAAPPPLPLLGLLGVA